MSRLGYLLALMAAVVMASRDESGDASVGGQGDWKLNKIVFRANGHGCGRDWLDIQADDEIEMGMVINAVRGSDCRPRSTGCIFQLNWKCANLDDSENKPTEQQAAVQVNSDGTGMVIVVPQYSYKAFDGIMSVVEANYRITGDKFEGAQVWNWTSSDGEMYCSGEDRFVGVPGKSTCDETWDANMDAIPDGPAPEGIWRIRTKTVAVEGDQCQQQHTVGFVSHSAVMIQKAYNDKGQITGQNFEAIVQCSTDEDQIDHATEGRLVEQQEGGNITVVFREGPSRKSESVFEEDPNFRDDKKPVERKDRMYKTTTLTFCPWRGEEKGYIICDGSISWRFRSKSGGGCSGRDIVRGRYGECTSDMKSLNDIEAEIQGDAEDSQDQLNRGGGGGWEDGVGHDYYQEIAGRGRGESDDGVIGREEEQEQRAGMPFRESRSSYGRGAATGARMQSSDYRPRSRQRESRNEEEQTAEGYPIREYTAPKSSNLGMILVGVPLGTLAAGLIFLFGRRWYIARHDLSPVYSRMRNNDDV